jgi:hypothetical protein
VFDRFDSGLTIGGVLHEVADTHDMDSLHGPVEEAVLDLIAAEESSDAVERVA